MFYTDRQLTKQTLLASFYLAKSQPRQDKYYLQQISFIIVMKWKRL